MSNADIFSLGFEVDTSAMGQGKAMAEAFAKALYDVQRAMQAEETAARKAGDAERKKAEDTRRAEEAARRAADPHLRLADALGRIGQQAQGLSGQLGGLTNGFMGMGNALNSPQGLQGGLTEIGQRVMALASGLGPLGVGLAVVTGGLLVMGGTVAGTMAALARQQEAFMVLEARLKNVYGSARLASDTFRDLSEMAQRNGLTIDATAESFLRLARNNEAIGLTRNEMLGLTDAVQKLGRISGATQGELAGGLMQFSQALAAGRLNGDELRSIMENLPELAKRIADGLGVSVGQLRAMGAEGQLTSDKIVVALRSQIDEINKEFEGLPDTSEQAFTRVGNAWSRLLAGMGEALNSSDLMVYGLNKIAAIIDGAADAVTPETPEEAYVRIMDNRAKGLGNEGALTILDPFNANKGPQDAELLEIQKKLNEARYEQMIAEEQQSRDRARAPFVTATPVMQDLDKTATETKKITEQIASLEKAYAAFQARPEIFEPQEVERLKLIPGYIAALRTQLEGTKTPLEDYISKTNRMAANLATYGAGGAASLAEEASALMNSAAKAGEAIDIQEALSAVVARRMVATQQATEAMDADIDAQQRMIDAIGKGTQAQIDAEVATKAMAYQLQNFGEEVGPGVEEAVRRYAEKLRELLGIQREAADAQRAYNAEVQLGIEQQVTAAIRAGATAGEVARLRAELQSGLEFGNAVAGDAASVSVGGSAIPTNLQPYFDRASAATGIPAALLAAVAQQESGFRFDAVSPTGARGIMQVLPSTAEDPGYGVTPISRDKLFDPEANIMFGAQYLRGRADSAGLDISNPEDLRKLLRFYNGSDTPMGDKDYDSNVLNRLNGGARAVVASSDVAAERAAQVAAQRIAELEKEAAALRAQAGAGTMTEAQRLAREDQIRKAGEAGQTPEERRALEDAMRAKLEAQDDANVAARLRAIEDETKLMEQQAKLAKLPAREREVELRVLEEINRQKQAGNELTEQEIAALRQKIAAQLEQQDFIDAAQEQADRFREVWNTAAEGIGSALESAMSQALNNGKIEAEDILKGLVADITMAIFRAYVTKPLVDGLTSLIGAQGFVSDEAGVRMGYAHGGVVDAIADETATVMGYAHGGVMGFAAGGVVNSPTLFPMARGAGLMGEAGPEAVLPLKRGADGKLGVGAGGGGGTTVVVNDMRQAPGAEPVEVQESEGPDGQRMLQIMVRDEVRKQVRNGELDKEMRSAFGVQRQLTRR